ncbi:MAG: hypothetical protein ACTSPN_15345 [Promethearchaeota archaeon]
MPSNKKDLDLNCHEKMAKSSFNTVWNYLDKKDRTTEDDEEMVNAMHASLHHWRILVNHGKGEVVNIQRGEWIISRVYTVLERLDPALNHAKTCLKITLNNNIGDFDLAFGYEAMARASALSGNKDDYTKYYKLADDAGNKISNKEDKEYFFKDLKEGNWFDMKK